MATVEEADIEMEDAYDEEADSDFDVNSVKSGGSQSSSASEDEQDDADKAATNRARKRRKIGGQPKPPTTEEDVELDSGDEATIKEHKKERRKQRKQGDDVEDEDDGQDLGWRARTRAMRERDKEGRKQSKLATIKGSTIDVEKIWAEMQRPAPLQRPLIVELSSTDTPQRADVADKKYAPGSLQQEELITIKRTYKFAGEVHTEEKTVPKDSAEAKLWLAQQESSNKTGTALDADGRTVRRPLRKISRFDPNYSNLGAFKGVWTSSLLSQKAATGPKLNVVEKSKMDWAMHVDTEGLQEELTEAAKAKGSYLSRTDFLKEVELRKEEEARAARLRGA
ncbi:SWR1-complex protein 5 [Cyphellophora attinorum]|uniref:SWR1-complex protein 5 n=1 Tax=Cyphellophora attinorum TaxID=1664694 RepID=A0A0N1HZB1_9EURO|nr:SWR1-complex protein 5 [Phialophora attinorum]KPI44074.1 SWR1-complex protein 5 [Phialophora attinorum]